MHPSSGSWRVDPPLPLAHWLNCARPQRTSETCLASDSRKLIVTDGLAGADADADAAGAIGSSATVSQLRLYSCVTGRRRRAGAGSAGTGAASTAARAWPGRTRWTRRPSLCCDAPKPHRKTISMSTDLKGKGKGKEQQPPVSVAAADEDDDFDELDDVLECVARPAPLWVETRCRPPHTCLELTAVTIYISMRISRSQPVQGGTPRRQSLLVRHARHGERVRPARQQQCRQQRCTRSQRGRRRRRR